MVLLQQPNVCSGQTVCSAQDLGLGQTTTHKEGTQYCPRQHVFLEKDTAAYRVTAYAVEGLIDNVSTCRKAVKLKCV